MSDIVELAKNWAADAKVAHTYPPETHWYWRHVLTELRNRSGQ